MSVKLSILFKKRGDLSDEDFNNYWSSEHASMFTGLNCIKSHMTRYEQYHISRQQTDVLRKMSMPIASFDGCAEFHFNTMDDLLKCITNPEYGQYVPPDLAKFIDVDSCQMLVGSTETKLA